MKIVNPFQIHSWKIKSHVILVLSLQLALLGSILFDSIGLQIPLIRQLTSVIILLFIPGTLILRAINIGKIDNLESLLYTIGISVTLIMFIGFFLNFFCLKIGIMDPISIMPLMIALNLTILVLLIICYINDKTYYNYSYIDTENIFTLKSFFLFFFPILAIYGVYFVNNYHNNYLIIIFMVLLSLLVTVNGFFNLIPKNLYYLAIFSISIALLLHNSLISSYVWGCDIQQEYYLANQVIKNSYWDLNIAENANAMLSIVMLAPIVSKVSNIDLTWTFKIIFPLLFSLLPLGLYKLYEKQTTKEIALISCLFYIFGFEFYTEMLSLAKQQISELFFMLLILLMLNNSIEKSKKAFLSILFLFSMVVSHYGLTYIFMLSLLLSQIISKFIALIESRFSIKSSNIRFLELITSNHFILLFFVFAFSWYLYISQGSTFIRFIGIGNSIYNQMFAEHFQTQGADLITRVAKSPMRNITKYLHLISILFISVGIFKLAAKRRLMKFNNSYIAFSLAYFVICIFGVGIPFFASQLNTSRLYYMALIILAPFFSLGAISLFNVIFQHDLTAFWANSSTKQVFSILSIFLAFFFLFNSGLIYEINGEETSSVSLNSTHYPFLYSEEDIKEANWIYLNQNKVSTIYGDLGGANLLLSVGSNLLKDGTPNFKLFPFNGASINLPKNNYVLITKFDIGFDQIYVYNDILDEPEYIDLNYLYKNNKLNNIYDNGYGNVTFKSI